MNDEKRSLTDPEVVQSLAQLYETGAAIEIVFTNRETGFQRRSDDLNDFRHIPVRAARRLIGEDLWSRLYKFAFVRNPWDWVRSNYVFMRRPHELEEMDVEAVEWVRDNVSLRQLPGSHRTQHAFLSEEDGTNGLDLVGRFEHLGRDFASIADRLQLDSELGHLNTVGIGATTDSCSRYTEAAAQRVAQLWAIDIEAFGYGR